MTQAPLMKVENPRSGKVKVYSSIQTVLWDRNAALEFPVLTWARRFIFSYHVLLHAVKC